MAVLYSWVLSLPLLLTAECWWAGVCAIAAAENTLNAAINKMDFMRIPDFVNEKKQPNKMLIEYSIRSGWHLRD